MGVRLLVLKTYSEVFQKVLLTGVESCIPALGYFETGEWWVQGQLSLHIDSLPQNKCAFKVCSRQAIVSGQVAVQMQWMKSLPFLQTVNSSGSDPGRLHSQQMLLLLGTSWATLEEAFKHRSVAFLASKEGLASEAELAPTRNPKDHQKTCCVSWLAFCSNIRLLRFWNLWGPGSKPNAHCQRMKSRLLFL